MKSYRAALVCLALTCGAATLAAQTPARPKIPVGNPIEGMASAYRAADRAFQEGDYKLARGLTIELATRFPQDAAVWLRLGQIEQALAAVAVAEDEEGPAAALGFDALAQLGRGGGVGLQWGRHVDRQGYPG